MNQHPIYMTTSSPGAMASPSRLLDSLSADGGPGAFHPLSFQPQTTTYYSPAPTTFHANTPFVQDRNKDYLSSSAIHGLNPVRLPALTSSRSAGSSQMISSLGTLKEHPAAVQADQMNAYMEFFVDPEQSTSSQVVHQENITDEDNHMDHMVTSKYHPMTDDDKQVVNIDSPDNIKKRRLERERRELEDILRETNDIDYPQDPVTVQRERTQMSRARRAEAARSRYQRMSEAERKTFNQRRRLKALGIDPDNIKALQDPEIVQDSLRMANAKKAEAARLRYHRMNPDERREYNQRRTESFRRRRQEEEALLSTPAGRISAEALARAQQIMIRNARKAEAARARYQKMTPDERKAYNIRRAMSKKARGRAMSEGRTPSIMSTSSLDTDDLADLSVGSSLPSEPPANILESPFSDQGTSQDKSRDSTTDDIFQQMERDVVKRTKQAHLTLAKQRQQGQDMMRYLPGGLHDQHLHNNDGIINDNQMLQQYSPNPHQMMIDEKSLHEILLTGRDANGQTVELRTMNGEIIQEESQLSSLSQGQPILIQPRPDTSLGMAIENKDQMHIFTEHGHGSQMVASTSSQDNIYARTPVSSSNQPRYRTVVVTENNGVLTGDLQQQSDESMNLTPAERHALAKARRAERARIRYHSMLPEVRQEQNARRAHLLRKSRQRDEQLVQMAESSNMEEISDDLRRAIQDAQQRRARRAEQARAKYHRMNSEERRQYNAMRDAQRRQRKRQQEVHSREQGPPGNSANSMDGREHDLSEHPSTSSSMSPQRQANGEVVEEQQLIYGSYDMYDEGPMTQWTEH